MSRYLEFVHIRTGAVARAGAVEVTGLSEREVERTMRGMLINIGDDWLVRDTGWALPPDHSPSNPTEGSSGDE